MKSECPTCGSDVKAYRYCNSVYDATVKIAGRVSKRISQSDSSFDAKKKLWYNGDCPDAWHDTERRKK
jgi:hypothetical protein